MLAAHRVAGWMIGTAPATVLTGLALTAGAAALLALLLGWRLAALVVGGALAALLVGALASRAPWRWPWSAL